MTFSIITPEVRALIIAEVQKRTAAVRGKPDSEYSQKAKEVCDLIHDAEFGDGTDAIRRLFEVVIEEPIPKIITNWPKNVAIVWEEDPTPDRNGGRFYLVIDFVSIEHARLATDEEIEKGVLNIKDEELLQWAQRLTKTSSSQ